MKPEISSELAAAYDRDGYCVAERMFDDKECDTLKAEALQILRQHAPPKASVLVGAACFSPVFRQLADDPRVVDVLRELLPDGVMFLSDKIVFKSGERRFPSPWHIDAFYWRGTRPKLSVWIALDEARAENGTLQVVRGSQRHDWQCQESNMRDTNGEFGNVIDARAWLPADEVTCEVPRGSAIFFSDRLVHGSCPNTAGKDRYTLISTYHAPATDEPFDLDFPARHVIIPAR